MTPKRTPEDYVNIVQHELFPKLMEDTTLGTAPLNSTKLMRGWAVVATARCYLSSISEISEQSEAVQQAAQGLSSFCSKTAALVWTAAQQKVLEQNIADVLQEHSLSQLETEILFTCSCASLGLIDGIHTISDVLPCFPEPEFDHLEIIRLLQPSGRLHVSRLICVDDAKSPGMRHSQQAELMVDAGLTVSRSFIRALLDPKHPYKDSWACSSQEDLLGKLSLIREQFSLCIDELSENSADDDAYDESARLWSLVEQFERAVDPKWPIAEMFSYGMTHDECLIVMALLCKAVVRGQGARSRPGAAYNRAGDMVRAYTGEWLAMGCALTSVNVQTIVRECLMPNSLLMREGIIRPELTGLGEQIIDDESAAMQAVYELCPDFLEKIDVRPLKSRHDCGRTPLVFMDQLVLPKTILEKIDLGLNQFEHAQTLHKWNLASTIPYGTAVTMLFYGPPGVGKTACAEAIANRLGKKILVADYSRILNCYVGETPKNIVRVFRDAQQSGCVLFWDEADAMLFDRDTADKTWQVQEVNVLLQELERFDGLCILSTNRNGTLDKALARRITVKIEFTHPTKEQSRLIWHKLIPNDLPLGADVSLDRLGAYGLTGGEVKNAVLNAARRAAGRGPDAQVCLDDFAYAAEAEIAARGAGDPGRKIGYRV